jgi:4-hydroxy-2-oxoheptanedioate aldolase
MDPRGMRNRLADGDVLLGLANTYPSAAIIESVGALWDFVWIDGQHGQFTFDNVLASVRTADLVGVASVLRVPSPEYGVIGLYADTLPAAVMAPLVSNARMAAAVIDALRFPPLGNRSFGGRRPIDVVGRRYHETHEPVSIVQIETPEAVEKAAEIAGVDGVDVLFLGVEDLKIRLGLPIETSVLESEQLLKAMAAVAQATKRVGKAAGCLAMQPELFRQSVKLGYQLIVGGSDRSMLHDGSQQRIKAFRDLLGD